MKKTIEINIPDKEKYKSFSKDGYYTYCIRINACGIDHDFWMTIACKDEDEAWESAMEIIGQLKHNDCSLEEIIKFNKKTITIK